MPSHQHQRGPAPAATSVAPPAPAVAPDASNSEAAATVTPATASTTPTLDAAHGELRAALANPLSRQSSPLPRQPGRQSRTVMGVEIAGTDVSPSALDAVERVLAVLLGVNTEAQERLAAVHTRVVIVPSDKKQTEVSEFAHLAGTQTFDGRNWDDVRGSGGTQISGNWVIAVPEENLVSVAGATDAYGTGYSVALHEIAHTLHLRGLSSAQTERLVALYAAQSGGAFTEAYGASNVEEYFAQCTSAYFSMNAVGNNGPDWLRTNDADMYAFLIELYGAPQSGADRANRVSVRQAPPAAPAATP